MPAYRNMKAVVLLLPACVLTACNVESAQTALASPATQHLDIDSVSPKFADLYLSYKATAPLAAVAAAGVLAKTDGQVLEIFVEEGDLVRRGQPLARLDSERARLAVAQVGAELSQRQSELRRARTLAERGLVSQASLESLGFEVAELTAARALQELELDHAVIRAPIAGTIASRQLRKGQQLRAGDRAFQIADTSRLVAELRIPQSELHHFGPGQRVLVSPDALPELAVVAKVDRISPTIDPASGTFRLTAYVDNPAGTLAPGMFARVEIGYQQHENAMILPSSAVKSEDGQAVVYIVHNGVAERRVVATGIRQDEQVEILSGLGGDEQVFREAADGLLHDRRVIANALLTAANGGG